MSAEKELTLRRAGTEDLPALAELALLLWPEHTREELEGELRDILAGESACFLLLAGEEPVGFAQCQLRRDYVEGTSTSPVGYLEGIYVRPACRRQGWARKLLEAGQNWARSLGCREFASDCALDNTDSIAFHEKTGFAVANRIVCFQKKL